MKKNEIYECDHLPGEELKVVDLKGERFATLESNKTGRRFLAAEDMHNGPRLCLAHVARMNTALRRKTKEIIW